MACLAVTGPARAQTDDGGNLQAYLADVRRLDSAGQQKRIAGRCASACTAYLGARRVCVEPSAEVWFHAAHNPATGEPDPAGSLQLLALYPSAVRRWAIAVGALETTTWQVNHMLTGAELIRMGLPSCRSAGPKVGGIGELW